MITTFNNKYRNQKINMKELGEKTNTLSRQTIFRAIARATVPFQTD